jgi:hypothetical protein
MLLKLEEQAIGKAPHPSAATVPIGDGELQRTFRDCFNCGFDCQSETLPEFWTDVVVPRSGVQQILVCLSVQTTARVTAS